MPGNFVRVECGECGSEQVVFEKAASAVQCGDCGATLVRPTGGKAAIAGEVTEAVEAR